MRTLNLTRDTRLAPMALSDANQVRFTCFELDTCETCGGPVQAANAFTLYEEDAEKLKKLGVPVMDREPAEQFYDEETGMCRCDDCPEDDIEAERSYR